MTVHMQFYLVCTKCSNQFHSRTGDHYGENASEIRERAKAEGWARRKVPNGALWDLCPRCLLLERIAKSGKGETR